MPEVDAAPRPPEVHPQEPAPAVESASAEQEPAAGEIDLERKLEQEANGADEDAKCLRVNSESSAKVEEPASADNGAVVPAEGAADAEKGEVTSAADAQAGSDEKPVEPAPEAATEAPQQEGDVASSAHEPSRKIKLPNSKVGVLIGKGGETIKNLQMSSGAMIQITKNAEADSTALTQPVELVGSLESINKAEQLIKRHLVKLLAEAGGSTALIARGSAEGSHDGVDLARVWGAFKGVSCVLCRLACALIPAGGVFGTAGCSRRGASCNPEGLAEIGDGRSARLGLACHALDNSSSKVLVRIGDGRPVSIGKQDNLMNRRMGYADCPKDLINRKWRSDVALGDLPEDVLRRVFSKLQINEVVRTSILSSKWRHMWTTSSRLSLDCTAICGRPRYFCDKQKYTQEFIDGVNTVLQYIRGKVVEDLEVKFEFDNMLIDPLNDWISFAVSSHTKNLALDLVPADFRGYKDRYVFPFELFDSASRSRIRHIQLSCVSFKPHSQFKGFPNLKKLDLHLFDTERKDLDDMLSGCSNLEWLSLVRCRMKDELKVKQQLPRLLYLRIAHCSITKVDLRAENLKTFVFHGMQLPIRLGQVKQLEMADLHLYGTTFEYVLTVLPNVLRGVQNLTLNTYLPLEVPSFLKNSCSFSQLKILRLFLFIGSDGTDNILSLASFLRAAPLIEKLEMHFNIPCLIPVEWGSLRSLPRCSYDYMRSVHITGFTGIRGQLEFLVHIVENTPALEVLTIDPIKKTGLCHCKDSDHLASRASARSELDGKVSPGTKVHIL